MASEECIFCKIARKETKVEIVFESENFIAFPDTNPCSKGHTLIIPKKHFVNYIDIPSVLGSELLEVIKEVAAKRMNEGAEGFNIIANNGAGAGQVVMHSHTHLIPRKRGEKARVRFPC